MLVLLVRLVAGLAQLIWCRSADGLDSTPPKLARVDVVFLGESARGEVGGGCDLRRGLGLVYPWETFRSRFAAGLEIIPEGRGVVVETDVFLGRFCTIHDAGT